MDYESLIRWIYSKKFNKKVSRIKKAISGTDNKVFFVIVDDIKQVIRFGSRNILNSEAWALEQWKDLPVPKVILYERLDKVEYLIESKMPGVNLLEAMDDGLSKTKLQKSIIDLGKVLKKMHRIKLKNFGSLTDGIGEYMSWQKFIENNMRKSIKYIKENKLLKGTNQIEAFYKAHEKYLDYNDPRLLHGDLCLDNILIHKGKISIIDASDVLSGDPAYDIAMFHHFNFDKSRLNYLIKGYGKINMKKVMFYALIIGTYKLCFHHKHGRDYKGDIERIKNYLIV